MTTDGPDQLYPAHLAVLTQRTDRILAESGFDALVIHAGLPPTQFLDDQDYPFKVNPHFKSWVPVTDNPHSLFVHVPGRTPQLLFHRPDDFWHKAAPLPVAGWTQSVDVLPLARAADGAAHWAGLGRVAFIGDPSAFGGEPPEALNPPELLRRLHFERAVKTPYELECLRRASTRGAHGHLAALAAFRAGRSEFTAHLRYLEASQQREDEVPYNNIIAYNEHAAILHYQHLEREVPRPLRSFLIDAGAQFRGYASDITRTYAAGSGPFAELVAAVDEAQQQLCGEITVGRDYREVHLTAHRVLGDVLHRARLIDVPGEAALELGLTSVFFPHGIGHLLGLQVHDVGGVMGDPQGSERARPPGHPYLRLTRILEPGVVVTVEPGIYFIDSLLARAHEDGRRAHINWALVDTLRPCGGIRIEDNVAATPTGPENLTRDAFAGVERAGRAA